MNNTTTTKKKKAPYSRKEKYIRVKWRDKKMYATVYFTYRDHNGEEQVYTRTFSSSNYESYALTMDAACADRNKALVSRQTGDLLEKTITVTVNDLWSEWENVYKMACGTYKMYSYIYQKYVKDDYGFLEITKVTEYDIQKTLNTAAETRSNKSLRYVLTFWKYLIKIAKLKHIKVYIDTDLIEIPKSSVIAKEHSSTVTEEEFKMVVSYLLTYKSTPQREFNYHMIAYALQVMKYTGVRPAEVFGIIKSDIQDDGLHITGDIGLISDNVRGRTPTKTETSRRTIPLTDKCREILDTAATLSTNELVFPTYKGKAFNTSKVGEYIGNISKELGIDFRAYDLRHQFATDLTMNGVDDRTRMELMGHSEYSTTIGYVRSNDDKKKEAMELIK